MYWRVRRVSPEQVVKTYGVHACLAVSLLVNGFLLIEDLGELPYGKAIDQGISEELLYGETIKALACPFHWFRNWGSPTVPPAPLPHVTAPAFVIAPLSQFALLTT